MVYKKKLETEQMGGVMQQQLILTKILTVGDTISTLANNLLKSITGCGAPDNPFLTKPSVVYEIQGSCASVRLPKRTCYKNIIIAKT